jgi:hypothetical protein
MFPMLLGALVVAVYLFVFSAFVWLVYKVSAIRRMLENQGMLSGEVCGSCKMTVPARARVCGHCGKDLVLGSSSSQV